MSLLEDISSIKPPPPWFVARMEWLRNQPPPTIDDVKAQFAAGRCIQHERRTYMKMRARQVRQEQPDRPMRDILEEAEHRYWKHVYGKR